jgi:multisubunit Na+/H+ antiporter MnhB subunit
MHGKETFTMNNIIRRTTLSLSRLDSRTIRLILVLLTLILFILGAGAPGAGGGFSG